VATSLCLAFRNIFIVFKEWSQRYYQPNPLTETNKTPEAGWMPSERTDVAKRHGAAGCSRRDGEKESEGWDVRCVLKRIENDWRLKRDPGCNWKIKIAGWEVERQGLDGRWRKLSLGTRGNCLELEGKRKEFSPDYAVSGLSRPYSHNRRERRYREVQP
jgi:hypothetical protein